MMKAKAKPTANVQASMRIRAVSPGHMQFAHVSRRPWGTSMDIVKMTCAGLDRSVGRESPFLILQQTRFML